MDEQTMVFLGNLCHTAVKSFIFLDQIYIVVWESAVWNSGLERDVQVHKGGEVYAPSDSLAFGSEADLRHPTEEPRWPPHAGPDSDPWVFHQGDCLSPFIWFICDYFGLCFFKALWHCSVVQCSWMHVTFIFRGVDVLSWLCIFLSSSSRATPPINCLLVAASWCRSSTHPALPRSSSPRWPRASLAKRNPKVSAAAAAVVVVVIIVVQVSFVHSGTLFMWPLPLCCSCI